MPIPPFSRASGITEPSVATFWAEMDGLTVFVNALEAAIITLEGEVAAIEAALGVSGGSKPPSSPTPPTQAPSGSGPNPTGPSGPTNPQGPITTPENPTAPINPPVDTGPPGGPQITNNP